MFLAALAAIGQRLGPADYAARAIELAKQALPRAEDVAVAGALIEAAESAAAAGASR